MMDLVKLGQKLGREVRLDEATGTVLVLLPHWFSPLDFSEEEYRVGLFFRENKILPPHKVVIKDLSEGRDWIAESRARARAGSFEDALMEAIELGVIRLR